MAFSTQFAADQSDQSDQLYCSGSERVWPAGRNIGPLDRMFCVLVISGWWGMVVVAPL